MSEIRVTTFETTANASTNSLLISQNTITINSTVLAVTSNVTINTSIISIGNSTVNTQLSSTTNTSALFLSGGNVFPNSNDVYAWASAATGYNNCTIDRDYTIEKSPYGGIPMKIAPTGLDPYPSTYGSNTWNLAPAANGETWKISGWIRANATVNISSGSYLLALPANSIGAFISGFPTSRFPSLSLTENTWTYFEAVGALSNTNTAYMQIRPDGLSSGLYDTWYDGIEVRKEIDVLYTELVNTQIFTANGTWTKPSWATDGNELVIVHMWGGGGGGIANTLNAGGGGGAFVFGYFTASQCNATCNVVVGTGGTGSTNLNFAGEYAGNGNPSIFYANTTNSLTAYGGTGAWSNGTYITGGGGGGWLSSGTGSAGVGGNPLGGSSNTTVAGTSTFGGGGGIAGQALPGGDSIYGGGGGCRASAGAKGGNTVFGGGGGAVIYAAGTSVYGGFGGNSSIAAAAPGGGGSYNGNGARGEVRVYTLRKLA